MVLSSRRFLLRAPGAVLALFLSAGVGHTRCDPTTEPDRSDVANARAAVGANCPCAEAATHGAYVRCAADQANSALGNPSCAGFVKRCAARSTCGKPGFVTCCRTNATGVTKCTIKRDATACSAPPAGEACVGQVASCCDACTASGCATSTTTTSSTTMSTPICPTTTTLGIPNCSPGGGCGLPCLSGQACVDPGDGQCACAGPVFCGGIYYVCGGECPSGTCAERSVPPGCPSIGCECQ